MCACDAVVLTMYMNTNVVNLSLRLHSITCLCRVSSNVTLRDDQLEPVLNVLKVSHMILTGSHDLSILGHMILFNMILTKSHDPY